MLAKIHGDSEVTLQGHFIFVKLAGNFNKEGIEHYCNKVRHCVETLAGNPFAMLIDNMDVEGGTPEAYEELQRYNQWLSGQSVVAKAIVIKNVVVQTILQQRTPELAQQNTLYFDDLEQAEAWLHQSYENFTLFSTTKERG